MTDIKAFIESIREFKGGILSDDYSCWTLNNLAPRIVDRNFYPGFYVEHFIKDMSIALKEGETMGLSLPDLSLVKQLYLAVQAQGHGKMGTHALTLALEKIS